MDNTLAREIRVIKEISKAIVHERDIEMLLNNILAVLNREMKMLRGTITILHGDTLSIEASHGLDKSEMQLGHYHIGEGVTGMVAATGKPQIVPDVRKDKRFLNRTKSRDETAAVAFICVPIFHLDEVIGTLSIDREIEPGMDLERDAALLEIVGNITADAVSLFTREQEEHRSLREENERLRNMLIDEAPGEIVGNCREMQ